MNSKETAIHVKGKNFEDALNTASQMLGVPPSRISYEEKKKSFLGGVFSSKVELLVWLNNERPKHNNTQRRSQKPQRSQRKISMPAPKVEKVESEVIPLTDEQLASVEIELKDYLSNLADLMVGEKISINTKYDEQYGVKRLVLDVGESDFARQVMENAKLRESLEHLVRKKPRHLKRELPFRIFIDANSQRQDHEAELCRLAADLSQQALRDDKPVVLDSQSAYDRKIIHMALDNNQDVYTKSVGMGSKRKLMIIPNKSNSYHAPH